MEIFCILFLPVLLVILILVVVMHFSMFFSKKAHIKPPESFTVDVINATLYYDNGDKIEKNFVGSISIRSNFVYNRVFRWYAHYKANDQFLDWLKENKKSGFVFVDEDTLLPIDKITQIGLERSQSVIEVEAI